MATASVEIRHIFEGGWATDFGPTAEVSIEGGGLTQGSALVRIPYLIEAENVFYELSGGMRKIGGLEKLNDTEIESGEEIRGIFDFWRQGTLGSPTQKRVIFAGTKILADDADGSFAAIGTGLTDDAVPSFCTFADDLILSNDAVADVPMKWDQTTFANLGGSPPNFAFCVEHKNRIFAAGVASAPSTLYYSVLGDHEDWSGSGSGNIMIGDNDGDVITGLKSFQGNLIVFKGPNMGSIHRITGSTNSDFAQQVIVRGVGSVNHNAIFDMPQDIGFVWSDGTIRSIRTTDRFGDFEQGSLSIPINTFLRDSVNQNGLKKCWAATDPGRNQAVITLPINSSSVPNFALMLDYRFERVRFAKWTAVNAYSVARVRDPGNNSLHNLFYGYADGFVRIGNGATRTIDGSTAISSTIQTPHMLYGSYSKLKTLRAVGIGVRPRGNYSMTFGWFRDNNAKQTATVTQGGGDVLGPADDNAFTLDTSVLGGNRFAQRWIDLTEGDEGRSFSYEVSNSGVGEDLECHTITTLFELGTESLEND